MRTIKELLQLVYDYEGKKYCAGLCSAAHSLNYENKINRIEHDILIKYIESNKPANTIEDSNFWFTPFDWKPRNEWLLHHINLNK